VVPAVILAAGVGRRIAARTNGGAKVLLDLGGRSLLERSVSGLVAAGFRDVVVVTGHAAESVREALTNLASGVTVMERCNPRYDTANNIVSVLAAADLVRDGFALLNSDIVFDPSILFDVARLNVGNWLVVDGDEPLGAEEMKVELDERDILARISKQLDPATCVGEYIGICRFDAAGAATLMGSAQRLVDGGFTHLYYEDAIDAAARELGMRPVWTRRRGWTEIDDDDDYQRARGVASALDRAAQ
jgi:choline kinase